MKKFFLLTLFVTSFICFSSCSNDEEFDIPQEVDFTIDYTFLESGSMTKASAIRATGADVYDDFYNKYIKTKQLTPTTYSLTFKNKETGAIATINGRWDKKDAIRLTEGIYEVTGTSAPIYKTLKGEPSDTVYLSFNETINITKDMPSLLLQAYYDSYLLIFDSENMKELYYQHYYDSSYANTHVRHNLYKVGTIQSMFIKNLSYSGDNGHYIYITRNDGHEIKIALDKFPFERGKYYYFNDMTNSFDIPKMESGN